MKKLSDYIDQLGTYELARLRDTRLGDSSRDKKNLLKRIKKLEKALEPIGKIVFIEKEKE